jgi:hypothetical protein
MTEGGSKLLCRIGHLSVKYLSDSNVSISAPDVKTVCMSSFVRSCWRQNTWGQRLRMNKFATMQGAYEYAAKLSLAFNFPIRL